MSKKADKKAQPTQDEQGSKLFKEAIDTLEAGLFDDAAPIFEQVIEALGETHHLSILSYKSLVTITSNRGDFHKSLDWSLLLLESQGKTLGYSHADTTKTVNNICTMCITLGKRDIAEEVRQLAKDASDKERTKRSKQVRDLRARNPLEDLPQDTTQEIVEKNPSVGQAFGLMVKSTRDMGTLVSVGFILLLVVCIFGTLAAFKLAFSESSLPSSVDPKTTYVSTDGTTTINFPSANEVLVGDEQSKRSCRFFYGNDIKELGDLLLCPIPCKEYILVATPDKLIEEGRRKLFKKDSPEIGMLQHRNKIIQLASEFYDKNQLYPDTLEELGEISYDNPFTLRKDYPLVQNIEIPAQMNFQQFFSNLAEGQRWDGEAAFYPGALNCGHVSSKLSSNAAESFIIHACDGDGRLFRTKTGNSIAFLQRGRRIDPQDGFVPPQDMDIKVLVATDDRIDTLVTLLRCRLLLFYSVVFLLFLVIGLKINSKPAKYLSIAISLMALGYGLVGTFVRP
ncbi:MAG: hypothetical protein K2Z81_05330 [Cyanobacteria bacterium]|nr:hypothetical protein [Cyanobacteriota bacterium]